MRRSRVKVKKEYKGQKRSFIIVFIILLPILSIGIGYLVTKHFVIPTVLKEVINKGSASNEEVKGHQQNHRSNEIINFFPKRR
jgi:membrane-anchored glycerophosphoryl diester phosphodiesterase (GDPDase)